MKLDEAQRYGLKPGDVRRASASLMAGEEVGDIFTRRHGPTMCSVWTTPRLRHSFTSRPQMLIDTPTGQRVRLGDVADVRILPAPNIIKREGGSRRIDVRRERAGPRSRRGGAAT